MRCALVLAGLLTAAALPEGLPGTASRGLSDAPVGAVWFSPDALAHDLGLLPPPLSASNAQFLLGRDLFRRADYPGAAAALRAAIPGLEPIGLYGRQLLGEALFYGGEPREAAEIFDAVAMADPSGPLAEPARFRAADALLQAGDGAAALARYRELTRTAATRARRELAEYAAASAQLRAGEVRAAGLALQKFWLEHPAHWAAPSAGNTARRLRRDGVALPEPAPAEILARAGRLLNGGKPGKARRAADRVLAQLPPAGQLEARLIRALAAAATRDDGPAMRDLSAILVAPAADLALKARARSQLARLASRAGDLSAASDHYLALTKEAAGTPLAEEAQFLWAWTAFNAGDPVEAAARFSSILAASPRSARAPESRWYLGWNLLRAGKASDAARELEALAAASEGLRPQALYWQARATAARAPEEAHALYRAVASAGPPSWYTILARERLAESGPAGERAAAAVAAGDALPFPPPPEPEVAPPPEDRRVERAAALIALGLWREAQGELLALERETRVQKKPLEPLLALFERAGMYHRALLLTETAFAGRVFGPEADRRYAARAFPAAYPAEVAAAARDNGVDPYFLLALMKRESSFRPWVKSPAHAEGLLQLMPATARKILALHGIDRVPAGGLADPALNVPLGAWYISELLGRFGHNPALAAAAYNAGPKAVAGWLARDGALPVDEFVEQIPFRETRQYVRSVLANYAAYRALYTGQDRLGLSLAAVTEPRPGVEF